MYVLVTTDDLDKVNYYGPFNNPEEAFEWGVNKFDTSHTLSTHFINPPLKKDYFVYKQELN
jgi:hypothetical protein